VTAEQKFADLTVSLWRLNQRWHKQHSRALRKKASHTASRAIEKTNQQIIRVLDALKPWRDSLAKGAL
jgi:hypothetical protein